MKTTKNYFNSKEFNDKYYYDGNDLGYTYSKTSTSFRVWAPLAESLCLITYVSGDASTSASVTASSYEIGIQHKMDKDVKGTWMVSIEGDLDGVFYTYKVKNPGQEEREVADPYAKAVGVNGRRSAVVDFTTTNPIDWEVDNKPFLVNATDSIIYELHVRDLSTNKDSGIKNIGKFLEFTEDVPNGENNITRGINHIKELGVTHVHLLPVFDFASIDESKVDSYKNIHSCKNNRATNNDKCSSNITGASMDNDKDVSNNFNWGYDPENYNVPEGSYSSDPYKPAVRIREFKEMVKAFHNNGIRVVLDVVYNHTLENIDSKFHILVPDYYYRMNADGSFMNGSECNSETASERLMMRKYIVDSVKYWATEYHVDGFRFDLMGLHDIDTMNLVKSELSKIDETIIVYGEGWDMGNLPKKERAIQQHAAKMKGIGFFNDHIRDSLKGPWSNTKGHGFIDGKKKLELEIMKGVTGSISYNQILKDYNDEPNQSINYVEAHDNNTLWDKLLIANSKEEEQTLKKMDMLANAIVLTCQGIPFLSSGVEFLRTKGGDENSFKSPDSVNALDWSRKAKYLEVFNYYKGLVELRKTHAAFRMTSTAMVQSSLTFIEAPENMVAYVLKNNANGDSWRNIFVAYNANKTNKRVTVPNGQWSIVVRGEKAGVSIIEKMEGCEIEVSAISTTVMFTNQDISIKDIFEEN